MTAYSSHMDRKTNLAIDEKCISIGDMLIAFFSGFAIYTVLGNMKQKCLNKIQMWDISNKAAYDKCN